MEIKKIHVLHARISVIKSGGGDVSQEDDEGRPNLSVEEGGMENMRPMWIFLCNGFTTIPHVARSWEVSLNKMADTRARGGGV